jgi:conjugative relaxase-like TrwC/TraI family protein
MAAGQEVTADQMASLFGEGRHPNADQIAQAFKSRTGGPAASGDTGVRPTGRAEDVDRATALGAPFVRMDSQPAFRVRVARRVAEANAAQGVARDTALAAAERARIRTEVGREMFAEQYGRPAKDARELSSFIARGSRQATSAVAGFDLTFTPVKSVSALWAIAPLEVAEQVKAAHDVAVRDALGWLEREAIYTRGGHAGVQQLDTTGVLAAAFDHRDSRAGDPDLHTHVAVSSKVRVQNRDGSPGRWLALDGRVLSVTASERYNTRVETELHRRLGLTFTKRFDAGAAAAAGKRSIREISGMPEELITAWSTRRARIDDRRAQLAAVFQAEHGRPPTPVEAIKLAQQATLETRDAKHAPPQVRRATEGLADGGRPGPRQWPAGHQTGRRPDRSGTGADRGSHPRQRRRDRPAGRDHAPCRRRPTVDLAGVARAVRGRTASPGRGT